jgi:hypothetical protein
MDTTDAQRTYIHTPCGGEHVLPEPVFMLYRHEPWLFIELDCPVCDDKFPVGEFVWKQSQAKVGPVPPPPTE